MTSVKSLPGQLWTKRQHPRRPFAPVSSVPVWPAPLCLCVRPSPHLCAKNSLRESHMSLNPGTQNIENLGNSAETLRLIFRALDLKIFAHETSEKQGFSSRARASPSRTCPRTHSNSSMFSAIPPAPTQTHNSAARSLLFCTHVYRLPPTAHRPLASRDPHRTVVEQCRRENPAFSGLPDQTLFHRFQTFVRSSRAITTHHSPLTTHQSQSSCNPAHQMPIFPGFSLRHCYRLGRHFHHRKKCAPLAHARANLCQPSPRGWATRQLE